MGVDVEDELRTGQRACPQAAVSSGGGTLNVPAPAPWRPRLRVRRRRGGAAGELEGGERRRHGAGALQEAAPVHPGPARRSSIGRRISSLTARSRSLGGGGDELAVGDGPGGSGSVVVRPVTEAAGEGADASHVGRIRPALYERKGRARRL